MILAHSELDILHHPEQPSLHWCNCSTVKNEYELSRFEVTGILQDVMQQGRMYWVLVQHYVKRQ
jgi:hypothetical protein